MKNGRWGKEPTNKNRLGFKDGQLEELRRRWESLPDGVEKEEIQARLSEWSNFKPVERNTK
jgi:hypothetical protein